MKHKAQWNRLDNAAKIFPPTSNLMDPKVFRCACELCDEVSPELLQEALDETVELFPYFRSTIKKGFFWYYLEQTNLRPVVVPEEKSPLSPIYSRDRHNLLFEVSYYHHRINMDIFHALTDGMGSIQFFQQMMTAYLQKRYSHKLVEEEYFGGYIGTQMTQDGYTKFYSKVRMQKAKNPKAYQLRGERVSGFRFGITEAVFPVSGLQSVAKRHGVTMSVLLTTYLMEAIHDSMPVTGERRPVVISVPVDLRNYFPTESLRNFFGVILVSHHYEREGRGFETVLRHVQEQFSEQLNPEAISARMSALTSIEKKILAKFTPLVLKSPGLRIGNTVFGKSFTAGFSNLGSVKMPEEYGQHVRIIEFFSSTKKLDVCLCSCGGRMALTFTSSFSGMDVQRGLIRRLAAEGIPVVVDSNLVEEEVSDAL